MRIQVESETMTTEDLKAVIQHERDRSRSEGSSVAGDVEFCAGKFVAVNGDDKWAYVPVARVKLAGFAYR